MTELFFLFYAVHMRGFFIKMIIKHLTGGFCDEKVFYFFADEKTFYQYCGYIDRNVYFNFKPIGNHTGVRLMLGVDD